MKQVGSDAVRSRSVEDGFLAGDATETFFYVVGCFLEHQRPGTVAAAAPPSAAGLGGVELPQAERQDAELDALVSVDDDLPWTAACAWGRPRQWDVAVLLVVQGEVAVRSTPAGRCYCRRHYKQQPTNQPAHSMVHAQNLQILPS